MKTIPCRNLFEVEFRGPGAFCFTRDRKFMFLNLPGAGVKALPLIPDHPHGHMICGNRYKFTSPTLVPPIDLPDWHGYLTGGHLIPMPLDAK